METTLKVRHPFWVGQGTVPTAGKAGILDSHVRSRRDVVPVTRQMAGLLSQTVCEVALTWLEMVLEAKLS